MQTEFTPFLSLAGGALIGLSAVVLMLANGRIAGISGIVSSLLPPQPDRAGVAPSIAFVVGLILAPPLFILLVGAAPTLTVSSNVVLVSVAGLLVGFGAVYGNGCTSGHGVCGISRLSGRSIVATLTFMATAFATVWLLRHGLGG